MMANRVVVPICGEDYTFVAEESAAYMQKVGAYVSDKMAEILDSSKVGRTDAAVLTAANIADELFKAQAAAEQLRSQIKGYLDEAGKAQSEVSELKREVFRLQQKLENKSKMTRELLSPAGSPEALRAAVQNGAGAVYLGWGDFNARRNARNFSDEEFADALSYCHLRGVRVFLTLNTLLTDRELPRALETARKACRLGVDAVLVQDWGLLDLLRRALPDLPSPRQHPDEHLYLRRRQ